MLEYVVAPLFPYVNSLAISRLLPADPTPGKKGVVNNNPGLELMNILSAGNLFYAVGHYAEAALSQLFMMTFIIEISMLFWLTAQIREWRIMGVKSARIPVYMAAAYFIILVLLLIYAT